MDSLENSEILLSGEKMIHTFAWLEPVMKIMAEVMLWFIPVVT